MTYISGSLFVWLIGQELSQFSASVSAKCDREASESLPLTKELTVSLQHFH